MNKLLLPSIFIKSDTAYKDEDCKENISSGEAPENIAVKLEEAGADGIIMFDLSADDISHEKFILLLRKVTRLIDIPVFAGGHIKRLEDVKKYLYAGAHSAIIDNGAKDSLTGADIITESCERFGTEKTAVKESDGRILIRDKKSEGIVKRVSENEDIADVLSEQLTAGVTGAAITDTAFAYYEVKNKCAAKGISVNVLSSTLNFSDFKCNEAGLLPVIVQDYKTDEVLMLAWMNEAAFDNTLNTGMMTYYSRSRDEQWVKGETSGHFQYVKSMSVDCDKDTLLAKVKQVGAACHTGNRSCFYTELFSKEEASKNPLKVFSDVMEVINDRKENPKEGSYTTYLFEQGIDKVLKKCGEEAAEVIIAAKNPDPEEIKYELADFLYHAMVLMSMKGVTWEDIIKELANR